jgi:hypothetical protein
VPLVLLLLSVPIILIALTPLMLIQRYRMGKARRLARPWAATLNLTAMVFSAIFFLGSAAVTSIWIAGSLSGAAAGIAVGLLTGLLGLVITRWEHGLRELHYTPNRWLVLIVTLIVSARILYGLFHSIAAARAGLGGSGVVMAFGIPESLAAGGAVIGYYLAYGAGLRWQIRRWQRRALRPMSPR